ncbi:hypothetical protein [Amycolatopsis sp. Hca4]|uniref:hypothetical protein n=1 Tax=Amycolatopsis sp. Hca4 TaxID=2742131 RepID=UPI0015920177|nr:hypothetical protein [Amycolatopsis sp. Hca4]QKV74514.1 hypothetical protein HUT10_12610 [Amycolatopsis sp. Hca4]
MKRAAAVLAALLGLAAVIVVVALLSLWASGALTVRATPALSRPVAEWTPVRDLDGATGAQCDTTIAADSALAQLGEHHVGLFVRPQSAVDAAVPAGSAAYAEPTPDGFGRIVLSNDHTVLPCRYVWSTVAHEWTHVLQYRACGSCDLYADGRGPAAEIVADCGSALTGWPDYYPYLNERQAAGGRDGCSRSELDRARELRRWAR